MWHAVQIGAGAEGSETPLFMPVRAPDSSPLWAHHSPLPLAQLQLASGAELQQDKPGLETLLAGDRSACLPQGAVNPLPLVR